MLFFPFNGANDIFWNIFSSHLSCSSTYCDNNFWCLLDVSEVFVKKSYFTWVSHVWLIRIRFAGYRECIIGEKPGGRKMVTFHRVKAFWFSTEFSKWLTYPCKSRRIQEAIFPLCFSLRTRKAIKYEWRIKQTVRTCVSV